jgi:hypothetical protein
MKKTTLHIFTLLMLFSSTAFAQLLIPEVLYYDFNGSGTTVPNLASAPPVGTATANIMGGLTQGGTSICKGTMIGSGISSTTDYVNTGWAPNLGTGSWTISFRSENITPSATLFYIFGDLNTASFRCFTNGVAGANNWILRGAGLTDILITGGATVAPHMNTFVYDATLNQVRAYLDGVLVNTVAQGTPNITGTGPFKVVGYSANVGMPVNGHLDEFRVYSRALTPGEITTLYNPWVPSGFLGADQNMCNNTTAINLPNWPYGDALWSDASTGPSMTVTAPGPVTVAISGNCGAGFDTVNFNDLRTTSTLNDNICGGSYTAPSGAVYTTAGTYMDTILNVANCDSIITINLTVGAPSSSTFSVTSCDSYTSPSGMMITSSGTYMDTIANAIGCDSVMTINVTINQASTSMLMPTVCSSYTSPSGMTLTSSGTYMDTIQNVMGCDSVITIMLTVNMPTSSSMTASACESFLSPAGNQYTSSGTYMDTLMNSVGCDSVITINLTINTASTSSMTASSCSSYVSPAGNTYTSSGTYMDTLVGASTTGCDSIITINLTILSAGMSTQTISACDSYTSPTGNVYTSSGTYMDTLVGMAVNGCDSIVTTNLTINTVDVGATQNNAVLTATASVAWYQWIDCATGSPIANAINQSYTATANGQYAVIVTQNNCTDTSSCLTVTGIGVEENAFAQKMQLFPNPNSGAFTIDLGTTYSDMLVTITDLSGRVVYEQRYVNTDKINLQLNEANGMYFVTLRNADQKAVLKVTKQ